MVSVGTGAPSHADERAQFSQNMLRNIQGFSNLRWCRRRRCGSAASPATRSGWKANSAARQYRSHRSCNGCASRAAVSSGMVGVAPKANGTKTSRASARCATASTRAVIASSSAVFVARQVRDAAQPSARPWRPRPSPGAGCARRSHSPAGSPARRCRTAPTDRAPRTSPDAGSGSNFSPMRLDLADAVLLQRLEQFALGQFDAFDQRRDGRIRAWRAIPAPSASQRAAEIVGDARECRARKPAIPYWRASATSRSVRLRRFSISASARSSLSFISAASSTRSEGST